MIDIERLRRAMHSIAKKKGPFTLFALFRREDAPPDGWDLVVSSPWLKGVRLKQLAEFVNALKEILGERQLRELSRIVPIKGDDPERNAVLSVIQVDDGVIEVHESMFFDLKIKQASFLRAKRPVEREKRSA
jgi:hypothetical protein